MGTSRWARARRHAGAFTSAGAMLAGLLCACTERAAADAALAALHPSEPEQVLYSGCERVRAGPVCELRAGQRLTLWKAGSFAGRELLVDTAPLRWTETPAAGGFQIQLQVPAGKELRLRRAGTDTFKLELSAFESSPLLEQANQAKDAGELERALELAAALERRGGALEQALARGVRARVQLRSGRSAEASELLAQNAETLFGLGQLSEAGRDVFARLFILLQREVDIGAARAWLERFRERVARYPLGQALLRDHQGMLLASSGDPVAALREYREAERLFRRLGETAHERRVIKEQVGLLSDVGQFEAARQLQASLLPAPAELPVCGKAQLYGLFAWLTYLEHERGSRERTAELPELLARSEAWERRCGDPEVIATGLVNRGLWALAKRDLEAAARLRRELAALPERKKPELRAWIFELEGRDELARARLRQARAAFEAQRVIGRASALLDPELRGALGLAAVLDAQGREAAADAALRDAVRALHRAEQSAALGSLVYSQFSSRQRAAKQLVERLVARRELDAAFRVAVDAQSAGLRLQAQSRRTWSSSQRERFETLVGEYRRRRRVLDQSGENDWQLSVAELGAAEAERRREHDELEALLQQAIAVAPAGELGATAPQPGEGEYWLLLQATTQDAEPGWLALGSDGKGVIATQLEESELSAGAALAAFHHPLLAPFSAALARAEQIVLLPEGRAREFSFESWPLEGQPLGARRLAFGAALGSSARTKLPRDRVAISADPRGDLPFARLEADLVAERLKVPPERRRQGPEVTPTRLLEQLESSDFLHFAGHAAEARGSEGSALLLAGGTELLPWELFSARAVPREVVLSACAAGDAASSGVGWGLAQVLLALGAQSVVAPIASVPDREALAFQRRLYQALGDGTTLREAFHQAQRDASDRAAQFRLFIR